MIIAVSYDYAMMKSMAVNCFCKETSKVALGIFDIKFHALGIFYNR